MYIKLIFLLALLLSQPSLAQNLPPIPDVYTNFHYDDGRLYLGIDDTTRAYEAAPSARYTLSNMMGSPRGTETGIAFDFGDAALQGTLYYGLIPFGDSKHPLPVYLYHAAPITDGVSAIDIKRRLSGKFDMTGWQTSGHGTLGYRVVTAGGSILYDGKVAFTGTGPFRKDVTMVSGPLVNLVTDGSATISLETDTAATVTIMTDGRTFSSVAPATRHEIRIDGLKPGTEYAYTVAVGASAQSYTLKTAPKTGSRQPFVFAYCSDSRSGRGGGERNVFGVNAYIMKKIMALNSYKKVAFCQFTGDLINGYLTSPRETNLQYANWKRSAEPFWHYFPIYVGMGNHETVVQKFYTRDRSVIIRIDRFPFATESAEVLFAANFTNPQNGPASEDGSRYDPDSSKIDFPTYAESVYHYTYDNVAVIVLNSNYLYTPDARLIPVTGGNPHGYVMDVQLEWLRQAVAQFERDAAIDHIFVTIHTPLFPNGGHVGNDMWYGGRNDVRAYLAGKPVEKGIIERRDELLDILVNKSKKTVAILTGDEHNYNRLIIDGNTPIYPENYDGTRIKLSRAIYQINNGAAGAPYYAQEQTPWSESVAGFTTQNAVVYFHVAGEHIRVEVQNPDTLEDVDSFELR